MYINKYLRYFLMVILTLSIVLFLLTVLESIFHFGLLPVK
ncbi:MAG: hypothetical protein JWP00_663 [Chloroflexi bacterium]|jgi:hypothetical protein|nr:hypothetical protein [Chloroflexota bacterium]